MLCSVLGAPNLGVSLFFLQCLMSRKRAAASDAHESVTISGIQAWLSNWHRAGQRNRPRTNSDTLACHFCCTTLAPSVELFRITESLAGVLGGLEVPGTP